MTKNSIDAWGGIIPYLDATAEIHNGIDAKGFIERYKMGVSIQRIAHVMGLTRPVIYDYVARYERKLEAELQLDDSEV